MTGRVAFQGKTVFSGSVLVLCSDGIIKSAPIQEGNYTIPDLPTGLVRIVVNSPDPGTISVTMRKHDHKPPPPAPDRGKWFPIPDKYADWKMSPLTAELKKGPNEVNLNLD